MARSNVTLIGFLLRKDVRKPAAWILFSSKEQMLLFDKAKQMKKCQTVQKAGKELNAVLLSSQMGNVVTQKGLLLLKL